MIYYKYRPVSELTDLIFTEKEVWLSTPENLNDPFECSTKEIEKDAIDWVIRNLASLELELFIAHAEGNGITVNENNSFYDLTQKEALDYIAYFKKIKGGKNRYKEYYNFVRSKTGKYPLNLDYTAKYFAKQLAEVGIFSLSESCINQLMWSHYAEQSTGLAIGFFVSDFATWSDEFIQTGYPKLANEKHFLKVVYSDELPAFKENNFGKFERSTMHDDINQEIDIFKLTIEDPVIKLALSTKSSIWEYEKEWRYVEEKAGKYPLPAPICEIVFGSRCSIQNKNKYFKLISEHISTKVKFYEINKVKNATLLIKDEFSPK